jgi:hypothetical protein
MGNDNAVRLHAELVAEWSKGAAANEAVVKSSLAMLKVNRV